MLLSHKIIIKLYIVYKYLDIFLHSFIIIFIYHHQINLNLYFFMIFELTSYFDCYLFYLR